MRVTSRVTPSKGSSKDVGSCVDNLFLMMLVFQDHENNAKVFCRRYPAIVACNLSMKRKCGSPNAQRAIDPLSP